MRAKDIKIRDKYIVHIPGSERTNQRYVHYGYTPEGFLPESVEATVMAKQVDRGNGRNDGVRVKVDDEVMDRIPERYRNLLTQDNGHQGVWVVHSRSIKQSALDVIVNRAHREAIRIDRDKEKVRGIEMEVVAQVIDGAETKAGSQARDTLRYLKSAQEKIAEQIEAIENGTEGGNWDRKPVGDQNWPAVTWSIESSLSRAAEAVSEYEAAIKPANEWRDIKRDAQEREEAAQAA